MKRTPVSLQCLCMPILVTMQRTLLLLCSAYVRNTLGYSYHSWRKTRFSAMPIPVLCSAYVCPSQLLCSVQSSYSAVLMSAILWDIHIIPDGKPASLQCPSQYYTVHTFVSLQYLCMPMPVTMQRTLLFLCSAYLCDTLVYSYQSWRKTRFSSLHIQVTMKRTLLLFAVFIYAILLDIGIIPKAKPVSLQCTSQFLYSAHSLYLQCLSL
jgi:hypothetical protein